MFMTLVNIWEKKKVGQFHRNEGAYRFWCTTIKNYTDNDFIEYTRDIAHFNNNRKNIFKFASNKSLIIEI